MARVTGHYRSCSPTSPGNSSSISGLSSLILVAPNNLIPDSISAWRTMSNEGHVRKLQCLLQIGPLTLRRPHDTVMAVTSLQFESCQIGDVKLKHQSRLTCAYKNGRPSPTPRAPRQSAFRTLSERIEHHERQTQSCSADVTHSVPLLTPPSMYTSKSGSLSSSGYSFLNPISVARGGGEWSNCRA